MLSHLSTGFAVALIVATTVLTPSVVNLATQTPVSPVEYRGSGRVEQAYRGSGRVESAYRGSGRVELAHRGSGRMEAIV